jgi:tRNA(His) 5'-end guanylyltransferase
VILRNLSNLRILFSDFGINQQTISEWPSDASEVLRAANDRDWRASMDPLIKQRSGVSRHPHTPVGRWIPWKVTGVHPNRRAEFHID